MTQDADLQALVDRMMNSPITRLGIVADPMGDPPTGVLTPNPNLCTHGGILHATVHVMLVDMLAGFVSEKFSGDDWTFTTDLSSRCPPRPAPSRVEAHGRLLRRGRNLVTADVSMYEPDGTSFGYGQSTFIRVASRHGDPPRPQMSEGRMIAERAPLDVPLSVATGVEVVDAAAGRVSAPIRDDLRNPAGAMQGAMVALVGELAAQALAEHTYGGPAVVADLDVRYLAMGRTGPVVSSAAFIGDPAGGSIHVELRDSGESDRIMTVLLARVVGV